MYSMNEKVVHLFHWPSFREYQENLLQVIAVPIGARGYLYYREKWVNETFIDEVENINKGKGFDAIFWALSCKQTKEDNEVITSFDFALPVRVVKILKAEKKSDCYHIDFVAKEFIAQSRKIDSESALKQYLKIEFGDVGIPYPGVERGFAYTGPKIEKIETTQTPLLEALYGVLEDIPCSIEYKEKITIRDYPLVRIETIEKSEIDKSGFYKLSINQEYKIIFSYYQGEPHRDRPIYIDGNRFIGKGITDKISIEEIRKSKDKINVEVRCDNLNFTIPLNVFFGVPWYKWRFIPFCVLFIISLLVIAIFIILFPQSDIEIKTALIFALIVMLFDKLWEVLTKKD